MTSETTKTHGEQDSERIHAHYLFFLEAPGAEKDRRLIDSSVHDDAEAREFEATVRATPGYEAAKLTHVGFQYLIQAATPEELTEALTSERERNERLLADLRLARPDLTEGARFVRDLNLEGFADGGEPVFRAMSVIASPAFSPELAAAMLEDALNKGDLTPRGEA